MAASKDSSEAVFHDAASAVILNAFNMSLSSQLWISSWVILVTWLYFITLTEASFALKDGSRCDSCSAVLY